MQPVGGLAGGLGAGTNRPQLTLYWFGAQSYSQVHGPPPTTPLQSQVAAPSDEQPQVVPAGLWQLTRVRVGWHPAGPASFNDAGH